MLRSDLLEGFFFEAELELIRLVALAKQDTGRAEATMSFIDNGKPATYARYCQHGMKGGLYCVYCKSDPDRLPKQDTYTYKEWSVSHV